MFGLSGWKNWLVVGAIVLLILYVVLRFISKWWTRRIHKQNIIKLMTGDIAGADSRRMANAFLQAHLHVTNVETTQHDPGEYHIQQAITVELDICKMKRVKMLLFAELGPMYWRYKADGIPIEDKKDNVISTYLSRRLAPKEVIPVGTTTHMDPYERDEIPPANLQPPTGAKTGELGCEIWDTVGKISGSPTDPLPFAEQYM